MRRPVTIKPMSAPKAVSCSGLPSLWRTDARLFALCILLATLPALNGWTAESTNTPPTSPVPVTIPIDLTRNRVMVPVKVNGSKPLSFQLDTGYGTDTIHPDLVEPLGLKRAGRLTIVGIAGEEQAGTYGGAVFDFGGITYAPPRVASLPAEAQRHHRRDGILGADFFRRFIVEIDSSNNMLRLYEPKSFQYTGRGETLTLQFTADTPIIAAAVVMPRHTPIRGRFEIDTGCDDYLCLGHDFVESNQLDADAAGASTGEKQGVGGGVRIRHGTVSQLQLGRLTLNKPPANFFSDGSPAGEGCAGHIGMAALRHWKVIFDYSRRRMILEPNDP
jgi:hypothetical protein